MAAISRDCSGNNGTLASCPCLLVLTVFEYTARATCAWTVIYPPVCVSLYAVVRPLWLDCLRRAAHLLLALLYIAPPRRVPTAHSGLHRALHGRSGVIFLCALSDQLHTLH